MNRVWIGKIGDQAKAIAESFSEAFAACAIAPRPGERWAVKLNLTYPRYLPGVINSPVFVEGLCIWGKDHGIKINFIEGDGGNGAYSATDAFDLNGITAIARNFGMSTTSISGKPWEWRETPVSGRLVRLPYAPFFRRHEYDRFISMPVFKTHVFTDVSLGMKNLWGCIPDAYRMYYHHCLHHGIVALCKELRPDFSIFDGVYGLRGNGPMDGIPIPMNVLLVADSAGAGEVAACRVMGIDPARVKHLRIALEERLLPAVPDLSWQTGPEPFARNDFLLRRSPIHYASIALSRFPRLQRLVYHSFLSRAVYKVVDHFRDSSAQAELVESKRRNSYTTIPFDRDRWKR